ncbi:ankyrin repeat-containing protein [Cocos nucifera]|uniref:Ankyrin repeat-containing protein n=1 Tax=Cocos nucifera TaxID=13894 RepID=A0A8K0IW89_COCNU|nr:ankyrin repeat-containing protein [Cocos nucifera]
MVSLILQFMKADRIESRKVLIARNRDGANALHEAAKYDHEHVVKILMEEDVGLASMLNAAGMSPLYLAIVTGSFDAAKALLQSSSWENNSLASYNAEYCIASCLALIKAHSGPRELHDLKRVESSSNAAKDKPSDDDDKAKEKSSNKEAKEISEQVDLSRNLGIASVLIATVTFAAGFTVPGGYIADDHPGRGTAVLATKYAFKVFLISDAISLVCSIVATCWLMYAGTTTVDRYTRTRVLSWAVSCLWVAFAGMSSAFAMAIYVVLAPRYLSIGILLCFIALGTPLAAHMVAHYNLFSLVRTVGIRRGYGQFIWASIHPHVRKRLGPKLLTGGNLIRSLLRILIGYAIFFLLAMI